MDRYQQGYRDAQALYQPRLEAVRQELNGLRVRHEGLTQQLAELQTAKDDLQAEYDAYRAGHP